MTSTLILLATSLVDSAHTLTALLGAHPAIGVAGLGAVGGFAAWSSSRALAPGLPEPTRGAPPPVGGEGFTQAAHHSRDDGAVLSVNTPGGGE
jgi:hypothetical protein